MTTTDLLRAPVTMSLLAYDMLWQSVIGEPHHPTLRRDFPEREISVSTAMDELHAMGLAGSAGVSSALLATIALFSRPGRELYGWYSAGADTNRVLGVIDGANAMVAHRVCDRLALLPCAPGRLPDTIGELLPEHSPIQGTAISVPLEELGRAGPARGDLDRAKRLLSSPRSGCGEFAVAHRDQLGRRHRAKFRVCYADTAHGRFLTSTRRDAEGAAWLTLIPANRRSITEQLRSIHNGQFC
jgi:hypothetical protein